MDEDKYTKSKKKTSIKKEYKDKMKNSGYRDKVKTMMEKFRSMSDPIKRTAGDKHPGYGTKASRTMSKRGLEK